MDKERIPYLLYSVCKGEDELNSTQLAFSQFMVLLVAYCNANASAGAMSSIPFKPLHFVRVDLQTLLLSSEELNASRVSSFKLVSSEHS